MEARESAMWSKRTGKQRRQQPPRLTDTGRWQSGATAIEYGLIASFVALAVYVGAMVAGNGLGEVFLVMADQLNTAMSD